MFCLLLWLSLVWCLAGCLFGGKLTWWFGWLLMLLFVAFYIDCGRLLWFCFCLFVADCCCILGLFVCWGCSIWLWVFTSDWLDLIGLLVLLVWVVVYLCCGCRFSCACLYLYLLIVLIVVLFFVLLWFCYLVGVLGVLGVRVVVWDCLIVICWFGCLWFRGMCLVMCYVGFSLDCLFVYYYWV